MSSIRGLPAACWCGSRTRSTQNSPLPATVPECLKTVWGSEGDHRIQSAECERIGDGVFHLLHARDVGNHVDVALWIGFCEISGWRQNAVLQPKNRRCRFQ